jgi:hypothetical protein
MAKEEKDFILHENRLRAIFWKKLKMLGDSILII